MILYHGSNVAIDVIDLSKSRPGKGFGKGFYLSADRQQAIEMAESKVAFLGGEPVVTEFEVNDNILTSSQLKVRTFESYTEEWAKFVYDNRLYTITTSSTAPSQTTKWAHRSAISRTGASTWTNSYAASSTSKELLSSTTSAQRPPSKPSINYE